jgi:hypothetical protein
MSSLKKIAGLVAGLSAAATLGVALAQGVPPNPFVSNHALGAGQQSTHLTSMGETGVPGLIDQVQAVAITPIEQPAAVVAVAEPAPAPAPVQEQQAMGAAPAAEPAPAAAPAPMMVAKADRN